MTHYIFMSGSYGCIPDYCGACRKYLDAVDCLAETFNLSRVRRVGLKKYRYLDLLKRDGADYCEIVECDCSTPWVHDEQSRPEDWPEYEVKDGNTTLWE